jgi:cell division protein FtsI/penicillin-binding protein 2
VRKKKVNEEPKGRVVDRRGFLKSFLGLTAVTEHADAAEAAPAKSGVSFFWANLQNGQVAFPTGMNVPSGQPGSVMKLITAAALRESGCYGGDQKIECRGSVEINKRTYKCLYAHGNVDLVKALGLSCNVFFATAAHAHLRPAAIVEYARRFGLDRPVAGFGPARFPADQAAARQEHAGDAAEYALGLSPEIVPNALQLLRLVALVAMKGNIPALHNAAEDPAAEHPFSLELQDATWQALQEGMRIADREGTAHRLDPKDTLKIAAKTGTAPHGKSFQSWIAGYFPFDAPKYAFCLRAPAGTSQDTAVPEAHRFLFAAPWP